ncbi:hypothetical protein LCGC14_1864710 [marine sediment metagenome]|uniref:Uncharacterized protein n=1 Tax=marine sediment metagenome TaxID=412755 RepID=A0A0F9G6T3_9ZZZZ
MTNANDIRIAEAVEPKPDLLGGGGMAQALLDSIDGFPWVSKSGCWILEFVGKEPGKWVARPFDSAPSWESDGIILEWVQGQDDFFIQAIADEVERLIVKREGIFPVINNTLRMYLTYGKKGDYATALLAVLEASGE